MTPTAAVSAHGGVGTLKAPHEDSSVKLGLPRNTNKRAVPATRQGRCECCRTGYPAGSLVVWDSVGLVLEQHRSISSRR